MRRLIYFSIPVFLLLSFKDSSPIGIYRQRNENFFYQLTLKKDSSFEYTMSFKLGTTLSKGRWKLHKDTLYLSDYEVPWTIKQVEEKKIDSLGDNSLIEVIVNDTDAIHIRGNSDIYVDGKPTKVKYDYKTNRQVVTDFKLWINDSCNNSQLTDNTGHTKFQHNGINKISFDYDSYAVNDKKNNYFVLSLSNYPMFVSPPTLIWRKWLLTADKLIPLECNGQISYIKLKKLTND